jgi:hypothetical protein
MTVKKQKCFEYEDRDGLYDKPVFFLGKMEKLVKCPYCKSRNFIKNIMVCHVTRLDIKTGKLISYMDRGDMTGSAFDCQVCKICIYNTGEIEFLKVQEC